MPALSHTTLRTPPRLFWNSVVANRCQRLHTQLYEKAAETQPASGTDAGQTTLSTRRLIEVRGHDAPQFLQGLTTANIPNRISDRQSTIYSAFLNAQGRLLQDVFIYPLQPNVFATDTHSSEKASDPVFLIEVDASQADNLIKWLRKYKLRSKVSLRPVSSDELAVSCVWDDNTQPEQLAAEVGKRGIRGAVSSVDNRAPGMGIRLLQSTQEAFAMRPTASPKQYAIRRYLRCVPEGQAELQYQSALVHESSIDYMGGVDFRKGCYVGQELVIRTQHTGVVRKRILPCMLYHRNGRPPDKLGYEDIGRPAAEDVPADADVKGLVEDGKRVRSKGKWIGGVGNVGLALCRLEDVVGLGPTGERVEGWNTSQWRLEWSSQNASADDLRLKAFIPDWWAQRREHVQNI